MGWIRRLTSVRHITSAGIASARRTTFVHLILFTRPIKSRPVIGNGCGSRSRRRWSTRPPSTALRTGLRPASARSSEIDKVNARTSDPQILGLARDPATFAGADTLPDGSILDLRWVVTERGVQITIAECSACHRHIRSNKSVLFAGPPDGPGERSCISSAHSSDRCVRTDRCATLPG